MLWIISTVTDMWRRALVWEGVLSISSFPHPISLAFTQEEELLICCPQPNFVR